MYHWVGISDSSSKILCCRIEGLPLVMATMRPGRTPTSHLAHDRWDWGEDGSVIRLVATDLDGTVVGHDGSISPRTRAALTSVMDAGIRVVFVTGRPPRWMREIADATEHRGLAVCANGAYVYDLHAEAVVESCLLSVEHAKTAVERLRSVLPAAGLEGRG